MNNTPFLKYNELRQTVEFNREKFSKSFDFSPWGGIEGFLEASKAGMTGYNNKGSQYRIFVPDVFRAGDMTGVAVSTLPFDIVKNGKTVDTSTDWKNALGGIPNPQRLIYNIAVSLCGGAAYIIPEGTEDVTVNLKYIPPSTISYTWDAGGINQFQYTSQFGGMETFTPDEIIHIFFPDPDMEDQPAKAHPFGVAMSAAWRSMAMNNTINIQSERGFIPPTLVAAEGMVGTEALKTETWFNRWIKNPLREVYKVINANKISIVKVGSGMDELKTIFVELKADSRMEVGQAFGIPAGLFMADKAYASEMDVLYRQWYSTSVYTTIYQTIQETMTEQFWGPRFDARMIYKPETLKVFQEDETKRAAAFRDYVSARIRPSLVAEMLGLDLPQGKQYKDFDEDYDKPEPVPPVNPLNNPALPAGAAPAQSSAPAEKPIKAIVLSPDEMKDLTVWHDKAKAWWKKGKSGYVDWENKHLPESIAAPIRVRLAAVKSEADISQAFRINEQEQVIEELDTKESEIKTLVEAINKAIETPVQAPVIINNQKSGNTLSLSDLFVKSIFDGKEKP
jgi:Phage portal protein